MRRASVCFVSLSPSTGSRSRMWTLPSLPGSNSMQRRTLRTLNTQVRHKNARPHLHSHRGRRSKAPAMAAPTCLLEVDSKHYLDGLCTVTEDEAGSWLIVCD